MGDGAGRNLVVCCDGTSNQFATNNTNVVKLFQSVIHDPDRQLTYYHPGLGPMETVGALTSWGRKVTKLLGLAIGYGLEVDVVRAYRFVMANYRPGAYSDEAGRVFRFQAGHHSDVKAATVPI